MSSEMGLCLHPGTSSRETFLVAKTVKNQPAMQGTQV